MTGVQLET